MSKAFTRESDDAVEEVLSIRPRLSGAKNYLTKEGADRLGQRLLDLQKERRALAEQVENPNTRPAMKRLDFESQKLQSVLDSAIIVEPPVDREKIALGAWVQVQDADGDEETYQIVGVDEADPAQQGSRI